MKTSRRTHYGLAAAGETDNAKLSIRTSYPASCKMYISASEGSGNTVTDFSSTGVVLDTTDGTTTVSWGTTNAASLINTAAPNAGDISTIDLNGDFLIFNSGKAGVGTGSGTALNIGNSGNNPRVSLYNDKIELRDASATQTVSGDTASISSGDPYFSAAVVDNTNGTITLYQSDGTSDQVKYTDSSVLASLGTITQTNVLYLGVAGSLVNDFYGFGFFEFSNGVPTNIDTIVANLQTAVHGASATKVLPVELLATI